MLQIVVSVLAVYLLVCQILVIIQEVTMVGGRWQIAICPHHTHYLSLVAILLHNVIVRFLLQVQYPIKKLYFNTLWYCPSIVVNIEL